MAGSLNVPTGTFASRYSVERELGRGATATVYLARDTMRGRSVAIKVLRPELAQSVGAERFLREIRISEKLQHPHIVPVLDSGESDGQLYFVLPHMEEGSLRQLLQKEKQLSIESAIAITRSIADALDYAHRQGLIHRDVKPENILFTSGQACLADFGIARAIERAIDESTTSTGLVRGTPAYMSPEQASGSTSYDGRSDIYSLALVFYEMLAGVPAFLGPTPESVIAMRFQHKPRELRVYRRNVSQAVQAVLDKALELVPADRFATATAFTEALTSDAAAESWEQRTSASAPRFRAQSRFAIVGAVSFAILALTGGYVATAILTRDPDRSRYAVQVSSDGTQASRTALDMVQREFESLRDISVLSPFELSSVFPAGDSLRSSELLRRARRSGVGRVVQVKAAATAGQVNLDAVLFDVDTASSIARASATIPASGDIALEVRRLINALLFGTQDSALLNTRRVAAAREYLKARSAIAAFDLRAADSLLSRTLTLDPGFADAAFDMGRIGLWQERRLEDWQPWIRRALETRRLGADKALLAREFQQFGVERQDQACEGLGRLARLRETDLEVWYDYATCLRTDNVVVRDGRTASRWRFRSSYQEALRAYRRAFELAPVMHRTFQAGGYDRLRSLLFLHGSNTRGGRAAPPDTTRFLAEATWQGDTLAMIPYPFALRTQYPPDSAGRRLALENQRRAFRDIARTWSIALPENAATKEAVAISLEMVGDPAALDTLRVARRLAGHSEYGFRLAIEEVLLRVSLGRHMPAQLAIARHLGDSLLATHTSRDHLLMLQTVAAVLGRCNAPSLSASLLANEHEADRHRLPAILIGQADSLTTALAMDCEGVADSTAFRVIENAIGAARPDLSQDSHQPLLNAVLNRAVRFADIDSVRLRRYASGGDPMVRARLALAGRNPAAARSLLDMLQGRATLGPAHRSPDAVLVESQLMLALGDTARAIAWMDPLLSRPGWMDLTLARPVEAASLIRLAAIRATLPARPPDNSLDWPAFIEQLRGDRGLSSSRNQQQH